MMRQLKNFLALGFALFIVGCQDVIELDLPDSTPLILINGRVTDIDSVHVRVQSTAPYFSQTENPSISDALVDLYEDGNWVARLDETPTPGLYMANFQGKIGHEYHIEVTLVSDFGEIKAGTWQSAPERMNRIFEIDSIYIDSLPALPPVRVAGRYPFFMFTEPAGQGDNYRLRRWINDTLLNRPQDLQIFNDDFGDGRSFDNQDVDAIQFLNDTVFSGSVYKIEVASISRRHFNFLNLIFQQTVQVGSTFDPPPAPVIGNIVSINRPGELALGYFVASAVRRAGVVAP
jgi:hypothetical protein